MSSNDQIKISPANEERGILNVLRDFPDSTSFVFQVDMGAGNFDYYMKLGDPVFTPEDTKYVSVINSMGYNRMRRELWFGQFFIPRGKELKTVTNKQLLQMLEETAEMIKAGDRSFLRDTLKNFKAIGLI